MSTFVFEYVKLRDRALWFAEDNVPSYCRNEKGNKSGHWSSTLDEMRKAYSADTCDLVIDEAAVTLLSLSRAYGPMPFLADAEEETPLMKQLWPNGNPARNWLSWETLAKKLDAIIAVKFPEEARSSEDD